MIGHVIYLIKHHHFSFLFHHLPLFSTSLLFNNQHIAAPDLDKARASSLLSCLLYEFNSRSESNKTATVAYSIWEGIPAARKELEGDLKDLKAIIKPPEPKGERSIGGSSERAGDGGDKPVAKKKRSSLSGIKKAFCIFRGKPKEASKEESGGGGGGGGASPAIPPPILGPYGKFPLRVVVVETESVPAPEPTPEPPPPIEEDEGKPKEDGLLMLLQMMDSDAAPPPSLPSPDEEEQPAEEEQPREESSPPPPTPQSENANTPTEEEEA